jgi:nucleoside-diphosphate-sugar epimerase
MAIKPTTSVFLTNLLIEETNLDLSVSPDETYDVDNPTFKAFRIYAASKLLANKACWDFFKDENPQFELVTLHPSMVYGTNLVQESAHDSGSNGVIFNRIVNGQNGVDYALNSVHVGDVAIAHVKALDDGVKSRSYILSGKGYTWEDVREWAEKYYPEEAKGFKVVPYTDLKLPKLDASRAEEELGMEWIDPEFIIKEVLDQ